MQKKELFNYFKNNANDPGEKRKDVFKKTWKIIKILLYLIAFSITLTGCVQSFVIKTSSNVGNSLEFYRKEEEIAPKVSTFKPEKIKNNINFYKNNGTIDNKKQIKLSVDVLKLSADDNILIDNKEILSKLRDQVIAHGGQYGQSGSFSSAINLNISNEKLKSLKYNENGKQNKYNIVEKNGKLLFRNESEKQYSYVNDVEKSEIIILSYVPNATNNFINLKTHIEKTIDASGKEQQTTVADVDNDGKYTVSFITGLQKIGFVPKNKLTNIDLNNKDSINLLNRAFSRDILHTFYEYSFGKESEFIKRLNNITGGSFESFGDYLKKKVSEIKDRSTKISNNNTHELFKVSQEEYALIGIYQNLMISWITELGLAPNRNADANATKGWDDISTSENKYDLDKNISLEEYVENHNEKVKNNKFYTNISFAGDYAQKPITTWGQAWGYGPFYGLLVYPLSVIVQSLRQAMPELNGWGTIFAILIAVIFTRLIVLALSFKSTVMQSVQEGLRSKKAAIEAKYIGLENNKQMKIKKNQEIQALYSKYNINPMDQFANILLSMPIFFAMWRVIQSIPEIKQTFWLGINFSSVSWQKVTSGEFVYLWILIVTILVQLLSQLLPQLLNRKKNNRTMSISEKQALKKSERTQKIMMIIFTGITVLFSAGVQVYWLFGGLWQIGQVLAMHKLKKTKWFKNKYSKKLLKN